MKIVKLTAENFKRLVAIEITPDGNLVILSGKNNSGKSSALDAMWAALGGAAACPDKPIREGAEKADVRLVLDNGLIVERTFTAKGTYLKVTAEDGAQYPKPQDMLDALIGRVGFDPLAFARKKPKDQVEELLNVVDIGLDLEAHELEREALYGKRADANREAKRLAGARDSLIYHNHAPKEVVSAGDIAAELAAAERSNEEQERAIKRRDEIFEEIESLKTAIEQLERERKQLSLVVAREPVDVDAMKAKLATVEADNEKVRANERREQLNSEACSARAAAEDYDVKLKVHDAAKATALATAEFPVPGLSFNDEGVLYNGIPFAQCSSSEKLKVAVAIAMAANPDLRVIQIREGSLLDRESMDVIAELAGANGYQVWVETVSDGDEVGIVIEDGMVAAKAEAAGDED